MVSAGSAGARVIGRYALYDEIAHGGMATVHLGRLLGPAGFARTVAIKRLHPQFAKDPEFVAMFMDEARLAARIHHPNVVATLDIVNLDGELFLIMEYVQGEPLSRLTKLLSSQGQRIAPAMAATIVAGVLDGLHAAHEAKGERGELLGMVHRDVSPQNVLVGVDGIARLLDFGVAKAAGRLQTTRDGQLKGKIAYMAPEQLRGQVSRATDVYAAAVILWEALTGQRLFAGENEGMVVTRVMQGCVEPPSERAPDVPSALDAITLRGLSRDPSKRFPTAHAMARALEEAVAPIAASKIGAWVSVTAETTLTDRARRVEAIETESARHDDSFSPSDLGGELVASGGTSIPVTDELLVTQLSSGVGTGPVGPLGMTKRVRRWSAAAFGVVATVALASSLAHRGSSEGPRASQASSVAAPPLPIATAAAPESSTATTVSSAPSTAPAPSSAPAPTQPRRPSLPRGPQQSPPGRSPHCDPPYYLDSQGIRIFKRDCL
jgi:serine/threonine protein kinase